MDMLSVTIWLYFAVFVGLNLLDWFSTLLIMVHFRGQHAVRVMLPFWKKTKFGAWCVRRGWVSPLKMGTCRWYDHELNPIVRLGFKYLGIHALSVKKLVMVLLVFKTLITVVGHIPFAAWLTLFCVLFALICMSILVVVNNTMVILKCLRAPSAVVG